LGTNNVRRPGTFIENELRERIRRYEDMLRLIIRTSADNKVQFDRHKPRGIQGEFMAGWVAGWADAARYARRAFPKGRKGKKLTDKSRKAQ
jgi:hypothetical protein